MIINFNEFGVMNFSIYVNGGNAGEFIVGQLRQGESVRIPM